VSGQLVVNGAQLLCAMGAAPSALVVLPTAATMANNMPAACIQDNKPMVNIPPFGMCMSLANPSVASATSAALGVLTPMPCTPNVAAPWAPGSPTVMIGGQPALNNMSKATCVFGGMISVMVPGQFTVNVP
jgi:uncharacterized Zn-binding protein involved in type VI secretion